ncbi:2-aminoethylphosphonate--pyruvate transaminase [Paraglaciecola hydrolytica]|uniref:2-aminoethylphosphonate--pyruvate transaminase n=1 Tax=Paraglaciecola hydrolytica TaxID=1799789 RepID=A0A148KKV4_9ALTE|nr:2-aminoethylphosphonate--pyruvate transaminase [Paraglaciecola hydrolytica]KXI26927.1 2-aminoethylphosphonate--pyruvate aminotransferase [Paraglaciecola hydrolytica]
MNQYLLLTPGPLTTSETVKQAMMQDWCTWDEDYNSAIVQVIREKLVGLATADQGYSSVLMQGSGTSTVEATIGTLLGNSDKLLVIDNGVYGKRISEIATYLNIEQTVLSFPEKAIPDLLKIQKVLDEDKAITHVAMVHCETTTGILNPATDVAFLVKSYKKVFILDAMSSFGGIPMDIGDMQVDALISSANKCIQGVPGFGFVIVKTALLEVCAGRARSLSLDLYEQWQTMEKQQGKWRFTSPTHVVRAFYQALLELEAEGGVEARYQRYSHNQQLLTKGMSELGFKALVAPSMQSPIITAFYSPEHPDYNFKQFYGLLKQQGFVIYPGKVSDTDCFRIGNIGEVYRQDIEKLLIALKSCCFWEKV